MRLPLTVRRSRIYRAAKGSQALLRMQFRAETLGAPKALRAARDATLRGDARGELTEVEAMRAALLRDATPFEASTVGEVTRLASKDRVWCTFLFHLARRWQPRQALELGTCLGVSGAYIAAALRLNGAGRLTTIEGLPERAELARQNFAGLGLDNVSVVTGDIGEVLPGILETSSPVDLAFIDGHKDGEAMLRYFRMIKPHLSPGSLVLLDDIRWNAGMRVGWRRIAAEAEGVSLGRVGVVMSSPGAPDVSAARTRA